MFLHVFGENACFICLMSLAVKGCFSTNQYIPEISVKRSVRASPSFRFPLLFPQRVRVEKEKSDYITRACLSEARARDVPPRQRVLSSIRAHPIQTALPSSLAFYARASRRSLERREG